MTTATAFITAAASEIGYTESPAGSNRQKFAAEAGLTNGVYWCAVFVSAIARRCNIPVYGAPTASTRALRTAAINAGHWVSAAEVRPGDVLLYHLTGRNGPGQPDHTGICVEGPHNGVIVAVEGNTSSGPGGSQDNGGGVFKRTRPLSVVLGASRPAFIEPPHPTPTPPQEDDMALIIADNNPNDTEQGQVLALGNKLYRLRKGEDASGLAAANVKTAAVSRDLFDVINADAT